MKLKSHILMILILNVEQQKFFQGVILKVNGVHLMGIEFLMIKFLWKNIVFCQRTQVMWL